MDGLKHRLKALREDEGLSLRAFADRLAAEADFSVTHDSIRRYESGERRVPSDYLAAVCRTFEVSSQWLLFGRDERTFADSARLEAALSELHRAIRELREDGALGSAGERQWRLRREWERFLEGHRHHRLIRSVILQSWDRSLEAAVQARDGENVFQRVDPDEIRARIEDAHRLLDTARPHLRWLSGICGDAEHAVYVTDSDGVVLEVYGSSQRKIDAWGVAPGTDRSESSVGTNGAGTALAAGRPVAVLGPEHFVEAFHDVACMGAPVTDPESGEPLGAIDLTTTLTAADPFRLVSVTYVVEEIVRELVDRTEGASALTATGTE